MTIQQHASFDSSAAELNATSKLVKAWESKNAKNAAKAGGVSLMALSLAACGGSSTTTTTTPVVETPVVDTPVVDAAQAFVLTTATNSGASFTGGSGNDTFSATHLTLNVADELDGAAGADTLTVVNTAAEDYALVAAKISNIETVNVSNQSGSVTGSAEVATVAMQDLAAGQTVVIGGVTFTAGNSGATGAQVAAAFADPVAAAGNLTNTTDDSITVAGGALTGFTSDISAVALAGAGAAMDAVLANSGSGYVATAGGQVNSVVFTSNQSATNVTDLNITGTAVSGIDQVTKFAITTAAGSSNAISIVIDGQTVTAAAAANISAQADSIATAINAYLGYTAAAGAATDAASAADTDAHTVTITTTSPVNITSISATSMVGALSNATAYAAAAAPTVSVTDGVAAVSTGYAVTADASKIADATTLTSYKSTGDVTFSNMVSTQDGGVVGNTALSNGNTTFGYKATATSANIAIEDGTTAGNITLTGAGLTTVAITSTGEKNTVGTIDVAAAKTVTIDATTNLTATLLDTTATEGTLTISGAGAVKLGTLDAGLDTVNASGNSGGLTAAIGTETDTVITGSSGDDKITASSTDSIASTAKLAVNAGAGTDTLVIGDANDVDSAADGARYTGFEALEVTATGTQDVSLVSGIEAVTVKAASAISAVTLSNMDATNANAITVSTEIDGEFKVSLKNATGTADSATINASSATASSNVNIEDIDVAGIETLTLNATTGTSGTDSVFDIDTGGADKLTSLTINGSADVDFNTSGAIAKGVTIDATSLTGDLTFAGNLVKGSAVKTGAGKDAVTTTAAVTGTAGEFVTYDTGAGKDTITTTLAGLHNVDSTKASVKIEGGAGTDTLIMGAADSTFTDASFQYVTGIEIIQFEDEDANYSFISGSNINANFASTIKLDFDTGLASGVDNDVAVNADLGAYTGDATVIITSASDGKEDDDHLTVTTGSGDDTVTITASSFAGGTDKSFISVTTGDGADTISVTAGTLATAISSNTGEGNFITAGKGADTITLDKTNAGAETKAITLKIAAGDSVADGYDTVTGFQLGAGSSVYSDNLDLAGTDIAANTAGTNGTDSGSIKSHAITSGVITFDDSDTFQTALVIGKDDLDDVLAYINTNITGSDTVAFVYDSTGDGSADSSMVFQQGTTYDTVVNLMSETVGSISTSAGDTSGLLHIM